MIKIYILTYILYIHTNMHKYISVIEWNTSRYTIFVAEQLYWIALDFKDVHNKVATECFVLCNLKEHFEVCGKKKCNIYKIKTLRSADEMMAGLQDTTPPPTHHLCESLLLLQPSLCLSHVGDISKLQVCILTTLANHHLPDTSDLWVIHKCPFQHTTVPQTANKAPRLSFPHEDEVSLGLLACADTLLSLQGSDNQH